MSFRDNTENIEIEKYNKRYNRDHSILIKYAFNYYKINLSLNKFTNYSIPL